ncbi:MAG: fumarylacetoacetase [Acidobacteriota bacterium]
MASPGSWVESANDPATDFPLCNLPFGVFARASSDARPAIGIAIGDRILDLRRAGDTGLLDALPPAITEACQGDSLNALMALGPAAASGLRARATALLARDARPGEDTPGRVQTCLVPMSDARMMLPAVVGDYTDFYASIHHATTVGRLLRPDRPLPSNYPHTPLAYHGRASSLVASGHPVRRPWGQARGGPGEPPLYAPSRALDYEIEVGFLIGAGNPLGEPIPLARAEAAIFGVCLVNDWSARDHQAWESQPLGPFLSKNFTTTLSPWVVPLEALAPFRVPAFDRGSDGPAALGYLSSPENQAHGGLDITLEVAILSAAMRAAGRPPLRLGRSHFRDQYWTAAQLVAHHASGGCNLRPGDLLASGTVSGETADARGCLLELTRRGTEAFTLPTGERRTYLEDGDEVIVRGYCEREGMPRIGFGECRGQIAPACAPAAYAP